MDKPSVLAGWMVSVFAEQECGFVVCVGRERCEHGRRKEGEVQARKKGDGRRMEGGWKEELFRNRKVHRGGRQSNRAECMQHPRCPPGTSAAMPSDPRRRSACRQMLVLHIRYTARGPAKQYYTAIRRHGAFPHTVRPQPLPRILSNLLRCPGSVRTEIRRTAEGTAGAHLPADRRAGLVLRV